MARREKTSKPAKETKTVPAQGSSWTHGRQLGGKLLSPEQIARAAVFLASDESDAMTGQVLHVNGGSYMP